MAIVDRRIGSETTVQAVRNTTHLEELYCHVIPYAAMIVNVPCAHYDPPMMQV